MQTDDKPLPRAERLTPEEIDALRRHYAEGQVRGSSVEGAATIEDVAEAFGLDPLEVRRHLDGLREARAVRPIPHPLGGQAGLLALAVTLLGAALVIHRLNPRPLTPKEQMEAMEERLVEQRARRPKVRPIHYPILTTIKTGDLPPAGFKIEFRGRLTTTTTAPEGNGPMDRATIQARLTKAIANAYAVARQAEASAPLPTKPLPQDSTNTWGVNAPPGALTYTINGGSMGTAGFFDPSRSGTTPSRGGASIPFQIANVASGVVESVAQGQEASLKIESPQRRRYVSVPAGFSVTFKGRQSTGANAPPLIVLPIDETRVARKLEWVVRDLLWRDAEPPDFSTPESRAALAKRATPEYSEVTFEGPLAPVSFRLPMTASNEYPDAAAAARATDRILTEAARQAASQVRRMAHGERRR